MEEVLLLNKNANLRHYPEDWNDVQEISGVDPDEGREEFLLNDPDLREVCINLERAYGDIPKDKIEAFYDSPEGKAEILASPLAEEAWNKKRGIKVRSTWDKMLEEAYAKKAEKQPLQ